MRTLPGVLLAAIAQLEAEGKTVMLLEAKDEPPRPIVPTLKEPKQTKHQGFEARYLPPNVRHRRKRGL